MSLKIPYRKYPAPNAPSGFCYAASVPVNIGLPAKNAPRSKRFDAIIDSGASACLFHASIGRAIGLDIEKGTNDDGFVKEEVRYSNIFHVICGPLDNDVDLFYQVRSHQTECRYIYLASNSRNPCLPNGLFSTSELKLVAGSDVV